MLTHRRTLSIEKESRPLGLVFVAPLPQHTDFNQGPYDRLGTNGEGVLQIRMKRTVLIVGPLWGLTLMVFC